MIRIEKEMNVKSELKINCEFIFRSTMNDVNSMKNFENKLNASTITAKKKRFFHVQHVFEVNSPQHQRSFVAHCDNILMSFISFFYFS